MQPFLFFSQACPSHRHSGPAFGGPGNLLRKVIASPPCADEAISKCLAPLEISSLLVSDFFPCLSNGRPLPSTFHQFLIGVYLPHSAMTSMQQPSNSAKSTRLTKESWSRSAPSHPKHVVQTKSNFNMALYRAYSYASLHLAKCRKSLERD